MRYILSILLIFAAITTSSVAQNLPERSALRKGNKLFNTEDYKGAAENYAKSAAFAPQSFEAAYNLSNALQKSELFDKSEEVMTQILADSLLNDMDKADALFNLGNAQFHQKKFKEALESYKSTMRINPADTMAKYNYAYTKLMMQQQEDQDQENQDQNQDQDNQDQDNQDKDQDQNQDQENKDDQGDQDQNQDQNDDSEKEQPNEPQQNESGISPQQQQQILDAIQAQEDKTQDKLKEKQGEGIIIPGGKNW